MRLVLLVVRIELLPDRDYPLVHRMRLLPRHFDHNRLLHLVRDDRADQFFMVLLSFGLACGFRHYFFSVLRTPSSCSRRTVWTRAISRRSPRIFFRLSVCPIFIWNFSLKSWSAKSRSWCLSSTSVKLRIFSAFIKSVLSSQLSVKAFLLISLSPLQSDLCNPYSTSRFTNVVRSGSLCDARRMASFASAIETPSISNKIFPGRTTATQ